MEPSADRAVISRKESSLREANLLLAPGPVGVEGTGVDGVKETDRRSFQFPRNGEIAGRDQEV